jgi:hypothetical protein
VQDRVIAATGDEESAIFACVGPRSIKWKHRIGASGNNLPH